jgi:hypothetical protein
MRKQLAALGVAAACLFGLTGCISVNAAPHQTQAQRFDAEFKAKDTTGYDGDMSSLRSVAQKECTLMARDGVAEALTASAALANQVGLDSKLWAEVTYVGTDVYCHQYLDETHSWAESH